MRDEVEKLGYGKGAFFVETPTFAAILVFESRLFSIPTIVMLELKFIIA
jgi:hypothetical protein